MSTWVTVGCAVFLIVLAAAVKCVNLGQQSLRPLDESFHAVVARNMIQRPWEPVLYKQPRVALPVENWQMAHVWMHKPPLAMWQMALSMGVMGESTFWMRFPGVLLGAMSCVMTLLIGRLLFDVVTGSIAAVMQAWLAPLWMLAHGYAFSDHVDTSLLFYVQLSVWLILRFAESFKGREIILAGVACGCAVLSKSFVGLTPLAMVVLWALVVRNTKWVSAAVTMVCAVILTAGPWYVWAVVNYPEELLASKTLILKHLSTEVELWGGPWDRVVFDYWPRLMFPWFVAIGGLLLAWCCTPRDRGMIVLLGWIIIVTFPHVLASTKTPTATVTLVPAMLLVLAATMVHRSAVACIGLVAAVVVEVVWTVRPSFGPAATGSVLLANWPWVIGVGVTGIAGYFWSERGRAGRVVAVPFLVLLVKSVLACTSVVDERPPQDYAQIGRAIREHLPPDAVLLIDTRQSAMKLEHVQFLFFADRSSYGVDAGDADRLAEMASIVRRSGGRAFLVSRLWPGVAPVLSVGPWRVVEVGTQTGRGPIIPAAEAQSDLK